MHHCFLLGTRLGLHVENLVRAMRGIVTGDDTEPVRMTMASRLQHVKKTLTCPVKVIVIGLPDTVTPDSYMCPMDRLRRPCAYSQRHFLGQRMYELRLRCPMQV